jgi:hypothetical protein
MSLILLVLLLFVIFGVRYTAPKITKAVQDVRSLETPTKQIDQTPLVGCSISRIYFGAFYQ